MLKVENLQFITVFGIVSTATCSSEYYHRWSYYDIEVDYFPIIAHPSGFLFFFLINSNLSTLAFFYFKNDMSYFLIHF